MPTPEPASFVRDDTGRLLDEWGRIAMVPAPAGAEGPRARLVADLARAAGADHVAIDGAGNVVATLDGDGVESFTYLATMDDLASAAAHRAASDVLHRDGDRFVGPCTETTSSDASALALIRYATAGPRPWRRLWVVFVVGEETGLTGARALVAEHGAALGSVIDLMGGVGTVSWNALGFAGLSVTFTARPRHSLFGGVSEVPDAMARLVAALHADPPAHDWDSVSTRRVNTVHAGTVFNHSPETGTVGIDIRSADPQVLADLEAGARTAAESAAADAGVDVDVAPGEQQPAIRLPGGRDHRLVRLLADAIRYAGHQPVLRPWSSSNVNVVYAAGLDGVVHDGGAERGAGRGTADEWTDIPRVVAGVVADCRLLQLLTQ